MAFPTEHVLQLTLNRPKSLNAMTPQMTEDMRLLLNWFEEEASLWFVNFIFSDGWSTINLLRDRVVIVTGTGRAFCAGADLKAFVFAPLSHLFLEFFSGVARWHNNEQRGTDHTGIEEGIIGAFHGFGSVSRRESSKPIIAAVNGSCYGGGTEMILNCDLVVANQDAQFGLPEVTRGVVAIQGGELVEVVVPSAVELSNSTRYPAPGTDCWASGSV